MSFDTAQPPSTTRKFALQVNDSGAWRNVLQHVTAEPMQDIEHHVAMIASVMGKRCKWQIIEPAFNDVLGICQAPDFIWKPPPWKTH